VLTQEPVAGGALEVLLILGGVDCCSGLMVSRERWVALPRRFLVLPAGAGPMLTWNDETSKSKFQILAGEKAQKHE